MKPVRPENVGLSSQRLERLCTTIQQYVDEGKLAGALSLIARRGQIGHLFTTGSADMDSGRPLAEDTIFRIYSMTKPITSAAAMLLFEEGRFQLADPLYQYLPEFKKMKVFVRQTKDGLETEDAHGPITIRDLFTHTAGLSYGFDEKDPVDRLYQKSIWKMLDKHDPRYTLEHTIRQVAKLPLKFHPGTHYHYSVAIDVLGCLIQVLSGVPFETFLKKRIFEPLGMQDTGFDVPANKMERFSANYAPNPKGGLSLFDPCSAESTYAHAPLTPSGGGGLVSTASDYLKFGQMLLNGGELDGVRLLSRKTVEFMTRNHFPEGIYLDGNPARGFGLGGFVLFDPARSGMLGSEGNFGWSGAAGTQFWIDPQEDMVVLLMIQLMNAPTFPLVNQFNNLVYQSIED